VHVKFTIGADGHPQAIATTEGDPLLQSAAREALERAAPFPILEGPIELDIDYRLSE
jgi:outer membrane biosynthesis protein TonB